MRCDPICALVVGVVRIGLVILSRWRGRGAKATPVITTLSRSPHDPKPFAGFIHKPDCPLCEQDAESQPSVSAAPAPPPRMTFTRGRRRHLDTTDHFCPHATCPYHGRVG